jgi:hypothetical protein
MNSLEKYEEMRQQFPAKETIIQGEKGVFLNLIKKEGEEPFVFGIIELKIIIGKDPTWYAMDRHKMGGRKVILCKDARDACLRKFGIKTDHYVVKSLRIVGTNRNRTAAIAVVNEW